MRIDFSLRGRQGSVHAVVAPNTDPDSFGCQLLVPGLGAEHFAGFPACTAAIEYDAHGYAAVFGWVQLVRSTDDESSGTAFEVDPIALYSDLATPFGWFGVKPTLFDAPFRFRARPVDWLAHSFLCFTPTAVCDREVRALTGFSWGFTLKEDEVEVHEPALLDASVWDAHLPVLTARYPAWSFAEGLRDG